MTWILRHRQTGLFVADDLLGGYAWTSKSKKAAQFPSLESARTTVTRICYAEKEISRKALLEPIRAAELRTVLKRRFFINRNRER